MSLQQQKQPINPVGMVHVVATDFNPSDVNENKTIGIPEEWNID